MILNGKCSALRVACSAASMAAFARGSSISWLLYFLGVIWRRERLDVRNRVKPKVASNKMGADQSTNT